MTHPDFDALFDLAHGVGTPRTKSHVDGCDTCQAEIAGQRQVLSDVQAAHRAQAVDPFSMTRQKRALMARIGSASRTKRRSNLQAAAALLVAACGGAAFAYGVIRAQDEAPPAPALQASTVPAVATDPVPPPSPPPAKAAPAPVEAPEPAVAPVERKTPVVAKRRSDKRPVRLAKIKEKPSAKSVAARVLAEVADLDSGRTEHFDAGELAALAGDAEAAAREFVKALGSARGAEARDRLGRMADDGSTSREAAIAAIAADETARDSKDGLKLLCQWGLAEHADRPSVMRCKAVAERYPQDPDVRRLALAAGRVAEQHLDDADLARRMYTRAILVSQYAGLSSTEALLARARVLEKLGDRDAAAADLRLYIHRHPESTYREDVAGLMNTLGVAAESE